LKIFAQTFSILNLCFFAFLCQQAAKAGNVPQGALPPPEFFIKSLTSKILKPYVNAPFDSERQCESCFPFTQRTEIPKTISSECSKD
jgi:hypothetical protein